MRKANRAALVKQLVNALHCSDMQKKLNFVVDGGYLLHNVRRQKNTAHSEVFCQYSSFVNSRFFSGTAIVFDGYAN